MDGSGAFAMACAILSLVLQCPLCTTKLYCFFFLWELAFYLNKDGEVGLFLLLLDIAIKVRKSVFARWEYVADLPG